MLKLIFQNLAQSVDWKYAITFVKLVEIEL